MYMKVAMFTDSYFPRINGVSISVNSFAEELANLGNEVLIICSDYENESPLIDIKAKSYLEKTSNPNINIYRVSSIPVIISKEDKVARLSQWNYIKRQLDKFSPDVIHINGEFSIGLSGLVYGKYRKVPIVFTFHTLWEEYVGKYLKMLPDIAARKLGKELVKLYLKRANEVIVPTQRIRDVAQEYGITTNIDILPTGIQKSIYTVDKEELATVKREIKIKYPLIKDKKMLLYVGRIVKEKNIEFLIDMYEHLQETDKDNILVIVGDGPYLDYIKDRVSESEYKDKIFLLGYKDRTKLPIYYKIADIFVFPSVTETQGLVTVEAMMSGLPVVAIGRMGTVDVMNGDHGGFMVEPDINAFTDKVRLLLNDKDLYEKKCQEALEHSKKWAISNLTPKLIEYYEKAIDICNKAKNKSIKKEIINHDI